MKHMKSDQVRQNWRDVLDYVRAGGTVIVEHYNRQVARIAPARPCAHGTEDAKWWAERPNWRAEHLLEIPPREAYVWCDKPGTVERDELYFCDEHAAERDAR
jgi:antitoxin (DNA-binding transcriptional repressor) of toxin-antitoxin stability system